MSIILAAALVLMASCAAGQSTTTVGGFTYTLISTPALFNTLATTTSSCPSGSTFSGYTGDDATAANTLASVITIFVNAVTQGGQIPVKLAGASAVSYISNMAQPTYQYICKAPAASGPTPSTTLTPTIGFSTYALFYGAASIQSAFQLCQAQGGFLASWSSAADRSAIQAIQGVTGATAPFIYTAEPTSAGRCQLATTNGLVAGSCSQTLPYICALPALSGTAITSTPSTSTTMPSGYQLVRTPITNFQGCFTACQALGLRFVPYMSTNARALDVTAVNVALSSVSSLYVNDNTASGLCPVASGAGGTVTRASCNQNLPFVCGPV